MNALIIHNDNLPTSLISNFNKASAFKISHARMLETGFSFDKEAHDLLGKELNTKLFNVIFIPYSLSDNYLELTGLRLALHIRLTPEWNHTKVPIVFIGHEKPEQIAKISYLGHILFTTGVFATQKFDSASTQKQYNWITQSWKKDKEPVLNDFEYAHFLSQIKIDPPANYQSHHSIDNELALTRWAEYIGCDKEIIEVKNNLQTGLYFKYYKALNPVEPVGDGKQYCIKEKANILLIDDEAEKGWKDFYKCFFKLSPNITFCTLPINFKSSSQEDIINESKKKVKDFNADVVLLDLRLCDADFINNLNPEELTGYKILQEIKKINHGIQVVITTASNKVWNYQLALTAGAYGYSIKRGDTYIKEDIKNLKDTIEKAIIKAKYLKQICDITKECEKCLDSISVHFSKGFTDEIKRQLQVSNSLLNIAETNEQFAYAYISLYKIIEIVNNEFLMKIDVEWNVSDAGNLLDWHWDQEQRKYINSNIKVIGSKPPEWQKFAGIYFQKWGEDDQIFIKNLYYLIKKRNGFVHSNKKILNAKNSKGDYLNKDIYTDKGYRKMFDCIVTIIEKLSTKSNNHGTQHR